MSLAAFVQPASAQPEEDREVIRLNRRLEGLIRSIDEIKWNNITIYRLEDEFRGRLVRGMEAEDRADIDRLTGYCETVYDEPLPGDCAEAMISLASSARGSRYEPWKAALAQRYNVDAEYFDDTELNAAYSLARSIVARRNARPKDFYLVTSRDKNPVRLIALLGVTVNAAEGTVTINKTWAGSAMYTYLRTNSPDTTMYAELKSQAGEISPSGLANQMFTLRDFSKTPIAGRVGTRATYLDEERYLYVLTGVSEGRPVRSDEPAPSDTATEDAGSLFGPTQTSGLFEPPSGTTANRVAGAAVPGTGTYPYELSIGSDVLLSFRSLDLDAGPVAAPKWGVEVVSNFDELNYPSIWGGRITANAILENIRIGAVLPQFRFGDSTIASSGIGERPQHILGGYGVAFSGDFTAPVLQNSGVFNFHASYTFDENPTEKMVPAVYDEALDVHVGGETGYLIRYDFQGFYTFGFFVDPNAHHILRLKLGGTVYGVDVMKRQEDIEARGEDLPPTYNLVKTSSESQGGVSGAVEYLRGGSWVPFGARVQYMDQSILTNIWLQFIVARNLDLKFDLKYFTPVFRDPHEWENPNLVVPAVTLRYHFGSASR